MFSHWKWILVLACLMTPELASAGGLGKLVGALIARGAVVGAARAAQNRPAGRDVLTIDQLAACLRTANALDQNEELIERRKLVLQSTSDQIRVLELQINQNRPLVSRSDQVSADKFNNDINRFNAMVDSRNADGVRFNLLVKDYNDSYDRYNAGCAEKYYTMDDMLTARKLVGL